MNFQINKAAVLGAGVMGAGIAAHLAGAGIPVWLLDMPPAELSDKEKARGLTLQSAAVRNRLARAGKERVLDEKNKAIYHKDLGALIQTGNFVDDLHRLKEADWIIEAVAERLDIKQKLLKELSAHCRPDVIISTNTSGISVNKMAEALGPELRKRFLGTHFFNPPRWMKLLEIIPGEGCLPELVSFMQEFGARRLGKGIIVAKDTPNFIANRVGTYAYLQVLRLMEASGFSVAEIDEITGKVMGRPQSATFRTLDRVGLDIFCHVVNNVALNAGEGAEKESFTVPGYVQTLLAQGSLGDKTGQGFYKKIKTDKGTETRVWDITLNQYVPAAKGALPAVGAARQERNLSDRLNILLYSEEKDGLLAWEVTKKTLLYAAGKLSEIAHSFSDIDKAMMWGFNWELGPFALWDAIGAEKSVERMRSEGEAIPAWIEEFLASGRKAFYSDGETIGTPYLVLSASGHKVIVENKDAALLDIGDEVACLQFRSKNNTISAQVVEMLGQALEEVKRNYRGLVVGNQNKNFSVGADLAYMGALAFEKKFKELGEVVENFQRANLALKYSSKPVVAAPYGMTLGAGAELVMHTHLVCASAETYMGLVEVGVGLIPGGGGSKEMVLRFTQELSANPEIELFPALRKAWDTIAAAQVSSSAHDAMNKGYLRKTDRIVMNQDYLLNAAKDAVIYLSKNGFQPLIKKPVKVLGYSGRSALQYVIDFMHKGGFISEYDAYIAKTLARIMTGGDVPAGVYISEEQILELEREAFLNLSGEARTLQRMEYMLNHGKPLRN